MNHTRHSVYSRDYAEKIIQQFIDSYARVLIFVAKKLRIDPKTFRDILINAFIYRNASWNCLRDALKYIDKHDLYKELSSYHGEVFKNYLTDVKYIVTDTLIDEKKLDKVD